jgi:hypothetical protein
MVHAHIVNRDWPAIHTAADCPAKVHLLRGGVRCGCLSGLGTRLHRCLAVVRCCQRLCLGLILHHTCKATLVEGATHK